jgi:excinuclease ABC subunit A
LSKRDTGRTLFILDEPTTGLHFHDIDLLLKVLHRLRDHGNTVVVIEHNLDVVKTADWVVDLGPEGGDGGGRILAAGTPEKISHTPESFTGRYLAKVLTKPNVRTIFTPHEPGPADPDPDERRTDTRGHPRRRAENR